MLLLYIFINLFLLKFTSNNVFIMLEIVVFFFFSNEGEERRVILCQSLVPVPKNVGLGLQNNSNIVIVTSSSIYLSDIFYKYTERKLLVVLMIGEIG